MKEYKSRATGGVVGATLLAVTSPAGAEPTLDYMLKLGEAAKAHPTYTTANSAVRRIYSGGHREVFVTWQDNGDGRVGPGDRVSIATVRKKRQVSLLDDYNLDGVGRVHDQHSGIPADLAKEFPGESEATRARIYQRETAKNLLRITNRQDKKRRPRSGKRGK